jgi:hypothetical protein
MNTIRRNALARSRLVAALDTADNVLLYKRARFGSERARSRIRQNAGFRPHPRILANAATAESRTVI